MEDNIKDYIIWLKSGETMSGSAKSEAIEKLQIDFLNFDGYNKRIEFIDIDGSIALNLERVEAIAENNQDENKISGFKS